MINALHFVKHQKPCKKKCPLFIMLWVNMYMYIYVGRWYNTNNSRPVYLCQLSAIYLVDDCAMLLLLLSIPRFAFFIFHFSQFSFKLNNQLAIMFFLLFFMLLLLYHRIYVVIFGLCQVELHLVALTIAAQKSD